MTNGSTAACKEYSPDRCAYCDKKFKWYVTLADFLFEVVTWGRSQLFTEWLDKEGVFVHKGCKQTYILERYL